MKFGENIDSIYSKSFRVSHGWSGPDNAEGEKKIIHTFLDKSIEVVDYGSRIKQKSLFTVLDIAKDDYFELVDYLNLKQGQPVRISLENSEENIFTEYNTDSVFYVYLTEFNQLGETDFSTTRKRFSVNINCVYIGTSSTDKQNANDSSLIDILIEVDTIGADVYSTIAPSSPTEGMSWYHTSTREFKIYKNGSFQLAFTGPADTSSLGLFTGTFYWSLFSDNTVTSNGSYNYKSGMVIKGSLDLPHEKIDINEGPTISFKNGFSFKIRNNDKFWNYITSNGINLFGASVVIKMYWDDAGTKYIKTIATGKNNKNKYNEVEYLFECEPLFLNGNTKVNSKNISELDTRYIGIDPKNAKKPSFRTFGRWDYARLQDVSQQTEDILISGTHGNAGLSMQNNIIGYIDRTILTDGKYKTVFIRNTPISSLYEYFVFTSADITKISNGQTMISINYDSNAGENKDKFVKVISLTDTGTYYRLDLEEGLKEPTSNGGAQPETNDKIYFSFHSNKYIFQIDENACGGFRVGDVEGLKVYGLNEAKTELEEIPSSGLSKNADNNQITISPKSTGNKTKADIYKNHIGKAQYRPDNGVGNEYIYDSVNYLKASGLLSDCLYTKSGSASAIINESSNEAYNLQVYKIPVYHNLDDQDFLNSNSVKLCLNFKLYSYIMINPQLKGDVNKKRYMPIGFKMSLRARKFDGTYINPASIYADWERDIKAEELGIKEPQPAGWVGQIAINNFPEDGEFKEVTKLNKNWDYHINNKYSNRAARDTTQSPDYYNRSGDYVFIENESSASKVDRVNIPDALTYNYTNDIKTVSAGQILLYKDGLSGSYSVKKTVLSSGSLYNLVDAVEGTDYDSLPVYGGKDLFDITGLFGSNQLYKEVERFELVFANEDTGSLAYGQTDAGDGTANVYKWLFQMSQNTNTTWCKIVSTEEKEIINRPLYIECDGQRLNSDGDIDTSSTYPMKMSPIAKAIIKEVYGEKYDSTSIDYLSTIRNYNFRKQFYGSEDIEKQINEILFCTWAVAFFDEQDRINFKSLNIKDYPTPTITFDESNIISLNEIESRKADEIFQKFLIKYNFDPSSMDSSNIKQYRKEISIDQDTVGINQEIKTNLFRSSRLYKNENVLEKELSYIYEDSNANELSNFITEWYCYGSMMFNLNVSISNFLAYNQLKLMDLVKINTSFYTNSEDFIGFVTGLKYDIYSGVVNLQVYIPRPKGVFGPYRDPINDALYLKTRDISGWNMGNGKVNDAGLLSTRSIGSYTQKDAGRVSTRNINF